MANIPVNANNLLIAPQGEFELQRNPPNGFLRAWDAADEYLLQQIDDLQVLSRQTSILIVNDSFGALSIALADYKPLVMSDSFLAQQGIIENLRLNGFETGLVSFDNGLAIHRHCNLW